MIPGADLCESTWRSSRNPTLERASTVAIWLRVTLRHRGALGSARTCPECSAQYARADTQYGSQIYGSVCLRAA